MLYSAPCTSYASRLPTSDGTSGQQHKCTSSKECGDGADREAGLCDKSGCDFNPYRLGATDFYGNGSAFKIDSRQPFTVVTQFITNDGTDNGDVVEVRAIIWSLCRARFFFPLYFFLFVPLSAFLCAHRQRSRPGVGHCGGAQIRRKYVQGGKVIENPNITLAGKQYDSVTHEFCAAKVCLWGGRAVPAVVSPLSYQHQHSASATAAASVSCACTHL